MKHHRRTTPARALFVVSAFVLALGAEASAETTEVSSCGSIVRGDAILVADLVCTSGAAVTMEGSGTLDLNGHQIDGGGVDCARRCTVQGPGRITGVPTGSAVSSWKIAFVDGVDIDDCFYGVFAQVKAIVSNSAISETAFGVYSSKLELIDSTITASSAGVRAIKRADLVRSSVTGNDGEGVFRTRSINLLESTVQGNCLASGYAADGCSDLEAQRRPKLDDLSVCEHSRVSESGLTWAVCSGD